MRINCLLNLALSSKQSIASKIISSKLICFALVFLMICRIFKGLFQAIFESFFWVCEPIFCHWWVAYTIFASESVCWAILLSLRPPVAWRLGLWCYHYLPSQVFSCRWCAFAILCPESYAVGKNARCFRCLVYVVVFISIKKDSYKPSCVQKYHGVLKDCQLLSV